MKLEEDLQSLIGLLSNVTDAYTAALFVPRESGGPLRLRACHSLSDHVLKDREIEVGQGLARGIGGGNTPALEERAQVSIHHP